MERWHYKVTTDEEGEEATVEGEAVAEEEAAEGEVVDVVAEITTITIITTTMEEAEGADDVLKTIFNSLLRLPDKPFYQRYFLRQCRRYFQ